MRGSHVPELQQLLFCSRRIGNQVANHKKILDLFGALSSVFAAPAALVRVLLWVEILYLTSKPEDASPVSSMRDVCQRGVSQVQGRAETRDMQCFSRYGTTQYSLLPPRRTARGHETWAALL